MGGRPTGRRRALSGLAVALAHLGVVTLGALQVDLLGGGSLARTVAYYAVLSGADSSYDFFAPRVDARPEASFQVTDATGAVRTEGLAPGANREAAIRVDNIVRLFLLTDEEKVRRSLAASWAGKVFARHPGAESVVFRLEFCDLPSMREYREGKQPSWDLEYQAKFVPQAKLRAAREAPGGTP